MFCVFCFTVVISEREGGNKKPGHGTCNTHSSSTDNNGVSSKGVFVCSVFSFNLIQARLTHLAHSCSLSI